MRREGFLEIPKQGEIVPPPEAKFDEKIQIKFIPGSLHKSPDGKILQVEALDFFDNAVIFKNPEAEGYLVFEPGDLKGLKRILREEDYRGEYFINKNVGLAVQVLGCDTKKNAAVLMDQEGKRFNMQFDSFVNKYSEMPEHHYAPFKDSVIFEKDTKKPIKITGVDFKRQTVEIADFIDLIDNKTGKKQTIELPETKKRLSFIEAREKYGPHIPGPEEIFSSSERDTKDWEDAA